MTGSKIGCYSGNWDFVDYANFKADGKINPRIRKIFTKKMRNYLKKETFRLIKEVA